MNELKQIQICSHFTALAVKMNLGMSFKMLNLQWKQFLQSRINCVDPMQHVKKTKTKAHIHWNADWLKSGPE